MYGQKDETGKVVGTCDMMLKGFEELPEGANVGDYVKDGKSYTPPNSYSILSAVKKGGPVWVEDADAKNAFINSQREAAYKTESDNLFLAAQYDGTEEALKVWKDKVKEIKTRYPKI